MGWTSLSVRDETKERFTDAKHAIDGEEPGVPDLTTDQFLNCLLDTLEKVQEQGYGSESNSNTAIDSDIDERLDALEEEIRKTETFAEEAKLNTETIKEEMGSQR